VFALSGLGGENDVSKVKTGDGIKKFEKHWIRLNARGGIGSGLPESNPARFCVFLSDRDME